MPNFSNGKIEVTSPEHSAYVQERLFELGYRWVENKSTVVHTDAKYLFTDVYGSITYVFDDEEYFKRKPYEQFDYPMPSKTDSLNLAGCVFKFPEDETKSKELQEYLFSQGYYWVGSAKKYFKLRGSYFVTINSYGGMSVLYLGDIKPTHELNLKVKYSLSVEKLLETVTIEGKTFLKSDYDAFLEKAIND